MEDSRVTRESEIVAVDPEDIQGLQMKRISDVNAKEARGDFTVVRSAAEYVNEAVGHRHGVVEQIGRRPITPRFNARPRAIAVAEQPELIRWTVITEAATKHDKAAGDGRRAALVERRRSMVLEHISVVISYTVTQSDNIYLVSS